MYFNCVDHRLKFWQSIVLVFISPTITFLMKVIWLRESIMEREQLIVVPVYIRVDKTALPTYFFVIVLVKILYIPNELSGRDYLLCNWGCA